MSTITYLVENRPTGVDREPYAMPAKQGLQFRKLFIGEWIARLKLKPRKVAEAVGISEPYLSLLISGDKKNPSARLLLAISEVLGITVNDLYRPPPSAAQLEAVKTFSPDVLARLLDRQNKPRE